MKDLTQLQITRFYTRFLVQPVSKAKPRVENIPPLSGIEDRPDGGPFGEEGGIRGKNQEFSTMDDEGINYKKTANVDASVRISFLLTGFTTYTSAIIIFYQRQSKLCRKHINPR